MNCFFYAVIWIAWWTGVQMGGMCSCMDFRGCFLEVKGSGVWNGSWQLLLSVKDNKTWEIKENRLCSFLLQITWKLGECFFKIEDYRKMHFISVGTKVKCDKDIFVSQKRGFFFWLSVKENQYSYFELGSKVGLLIISMLGYRVSFPAVWLWKLGFMVWL